MSGISNIGSYNTGLYYQQLEQALAEKDAQTANSAAAAAATDTTATDAASSANSASTSSTTSLQDKIKTAIISAVHEAENSGGSGDLLSIIQDAVEKTLKDAGIDPATAGDNDKVDPSTKKLLSMLDKQAKVEAQTMNILGSLDTTSGTDSSPTDLLSQLTVPAASTQTNQNLLGYLFDAQQ